MKNRPVARLTTPGQMVASLPLHLGYTPTESLVVACCYEPRGRMGLTMRFDLPRPEHEALLVHEISRRVKHQSAQRLLIAIYTEQADAGTRVRRELFELLRDACTGIRITEALLVRDGRFWSYLCDVEACCPAEGRPVDHEEHTSPVQLIAAENAFSGRVVLQDRAALEASLAGPAFLAAAAAGQRCEQLAAILTEAIAEGGLASAQDSSMTGWEMAVERFASPPAQLTDVEAAALAISLVDVEVRDAIAAWPTSEVPAVLALLEELVRRTPAPYDAPVCTLFAWMTYCQGGGAAVTIALERALASDPTYSMAHVLGEALNGQVLPKQLRKVTKTAGLLQRRRWQDRRAG